MKIAVVGATGRTGSAGRRAGAGAWPPSDERRELMTESAIVAHALSITRGGNSVLHGIDCTIATGTITGLLRPSGCGKTTLMRAIIGTQRITSGAITVLGQPAGSPPLRRLVGYASQQASVYVDLTVEENVRYFAAAVGAAASDVDRVIEQVDLTSQRRELVGRLSGGQRSRVSLAVAMLGTPSVLILDEPTVGLDPVLRAELWELFRQLAHTGMTLLVSSHVMDEAERCHDVVLMRQGRVIAQAGPSDLKRRAGADSLDAAFLRLVNGDAA